MLTQVEGIVKTAVGFDPSRGDTVTVENVPFYEPDDSLKEALAQTDTLNLISTIGRVSVPILALLLFVFFLVWPMTKFLITPTEAEVDLNRLLPTGLQELETELETERSKAVIPEFEPAVDLEQLGEIMAENSRMVKENPQQAALLIRYWLNDGRI
jgi:flagellar M-ring protein FliF